MNKCKRCNVWVADDTMVCPLCHTILTEEKSKGQKSGSGFPDSEFEYNGARYVDIDSVADKRFLIQGPGYPDVKKYKTFPKSRANSPVYFACVRNAACIYQLSDI